MTDTIVVPSKFHGLRTWRHVETERVTAAGRRTTRSTWESVSGCIICGARFRIAVKPPAGHDFQLISCERHRLSKSESMRLRRASDAARPAMFEAIKAAKLAAAPQP